jgi:small-conductance mechanosensitive channel
MHPDTLSFLPTLLTKALAALPAALLVLGGALLLRFLLSRALVLLAARTRLETTDLLPVRRVLYLALHVITAVLLLTVFGVNLGGLWAILSTILAMVAIGFVAVWSLLSNLSSTVMILLFRPFSVGDEVEFPGEPIKGKVADLNFLYTTLRAEDGASIQIPNNLFFQKCLKRRHSLAPISLAQQLNRTEAAEV